MIAFLSYSSRDKALARRVAEMLRFRDVEVWFDDRDLLPGQPIGSTIVSGQSKCTHIVALITQESAASNWVRFELNNILERLVKNDIRLVPLVLGDVPVPEILSAYRWVQCRNDGDIEKAINQAFDVRSRQVISIDTRNTHPAPRYGLRLIPSADFHTDGHLGTRERKYVLISDYFQQTGRTLREVQENIFHGQYFEKIESAHTNWIGIVFEIGEIHSKNYDVFPATWKSIYRILTHPRRYPMFEPSKQAVKALRQPPRDYARDDSHDWKWWVLDHVSYEDLETLFGLYNDCFDGDTGIANRGSRIFLVRNLSLKSLNYRKIDLGIPSDGLRVE